MYSLVAHDRLEPYYKYDKISISDRAIPNDATVKKLKSLGATFNFIGIWLKLLGENCCARTESHNNAMEETFNQIPKNVERALTSSEKNQKLMTDIGGGWYLKKCARGIPPSKRRKLSKKAQERHDYIQKKLYESNRWWNDWKLQLHWNKLEWADPESTPKIVKPF